MCPWSSDFEVLYERSIQLWLNLSLLNIIVNSLRCVPSSPITTALRIRCYIKQYLLVDMFLSSHCPSWKCIDVIRGNYSNSFLNLLLFPILYAVCHISLTNITLRITHYIKQYPLIDIFFLPSHCLNWKFIDIASHSTVSHNQSHWFPIFLFISPFKKRDPGDEIDMYLMQADYSRTTCATVLNNWNPCQ